MGIGQDTDYLRWLWEQMMTQDQVGTGLSPGHVAGIAGITLPRSGDEDPLDRMRLAARRRGQSPPSYVQPTGPNSGAVSGNWNTSPWGPPGPPSLHEALLGGTDLSGIPIRR